MCCYILQQMAPQVLNRQTIYRLMILYATQKLHFGIFVLLFPPQSFKFNYRKGKALFRFKRIFFVCCYYSSTLQFHCAKLRIYVTQIQWRILTRFRKLFVCIHIFRDWRILLFYINGSKSNKIVLPWRKIKNAAGKLIGKWLRKIWVSLFSILIFFSF